MSTPPIGGRSPPNSNKNTRFENLDRAFIATSENVANLGKAYIEELGNLSEVEAKAEKLARHEGRFDQSPLQGRATDETGQKKSSSIFQRIGNAFSNALSWLKNLFSCFGKQG